MPSRQHAPTGAWQPGESGIPCALGKTHPSVSPGVGAQQSAGCFEEAELARRGVPPTKRTMLDLMAGAWQSTASRCRSTSRSFRPF